MVAFWGLLVYAPQLLIVALVLVAGFVIIPLVWSSVQGTKTGGAPKKVDSQFERYSTYPPDWSARKEEVINRDGNYCSACGAAGGLHLHHILPMSKGGSHRLDNLILLCASCHSDAHEGRDFSKTPSNFKPPIQRRHDKLIQAVESGVRVSFEYKKYGEPVGSRRTVMPLGFEEVPHRSGENSTLCLVAHCELRNAKRKFSLKRMKGVRLLKS